MRTVIQPPALSPLTTGGIWKRRVVVSDGVSIKNRQYTVAKPQQQAGETQCRTEDKFMFSLERRRQI